MADPAAEEDPAAPTEARVVVAGEALVDLTPGTSDDGRPALVPVPGGAPLNVSVAASRLGASVAWSGPLGPDGFAGELRSRLAEEGIDATLVAEVDAPTSLAAVHLDGAGRAEYVFYLDGTTLRHRDAVLPQLPDGTPLVVACGAIGLVDEPYGIRLAAAVHEESTRRPVWLDPNVRPSAVEHRESYRALLDALVAGCAVVKVSDDDLAWLLDGDREQAVAQARRWASAGPGLVVLTLGQDGALALRPERDDVAVEGVAVEVVDTVGAGDTVTGTLIAELQTRDALDRQGVLRLSDDVLAEVLRTCVTAAAVTCTRRGADPPTRAELGGS